MVYDAPSCSEIGSTRKQVHDCFESRGYVIQKFINNSEMVAPRLKAKSAMLREFDILV